jgi:hypothetical protein
MTLQSQGESLDNDTLPSHDFPDFFNPENPARTYLQLLAIE